jgi:hypothetical protein
MIPDRLQPQRFELKYLVSEGKALEVREFVRCYLEIDEYGESMPNFSYPVHSLYLDSGDLKLYHATINGDRNRVKLRIRYYHDRADSPVFFEIKRRSNNCIMKQRSAIQGAVRREAIEWLLAGHLPDPSHLVSDESRSLVALQRFCFLLNQIQARTKAQVSYLREAWISRRDNSVRVTMDRQVVCVPRFNSEISVGIDSMVPNVFGRKVILELKFTNRFPVWFRELVERFDLVQAGAAKYVDGITLMGIERFATAMHPIGLANSEVQARAWARLAREPEAKAEFPAKEAWQWSG